MNNLIFESARILNLVYCFNRMRGMSSIRRFNSNSLKFVFSKEEVFSCYLNGGFM